MSSAKVIPIKNAEAKIIRESKKPATVYQAKITAKPLSVLPFRIRITSVGIEGSTIPAIGIAIVGYNNYIL